MISAMLKIDQVKIQDFNSGHDRCQDLLEGIEDIARLLGTRHRYFLPLNSISCELE